MLEILRMAQIFSEMQDSKQTEDPLTVIQSAVTSNKKINPQFLEDKVQSPEIRMLKEVIPLMDSRYRHVLERFIKIIELQRLTELYSGIAVNLGKGNTDWRIEMLGAMRPHLDAEKREMIDIAMWMLSLSNLTHRMRNRSVTRHDKY